MGKSPRSNPLMTAISSTGSSGGSRKPHFFKILVGDDFRRRLRIPPKFMKNTADRGSLLASKRATLVDPSGRRWDAELVRTADGIFFSNGWSVFASDCCLEEHDFLVFRYDGNSQFTVLFFDKTACQKKTNPPRPSHRRQPETGNQSRTAPPVPTQGEFMQRTVSAGHDLDVKMEEHKEDANHYDELSPRDMAKSFRSQYPFFVAKVSAHSMYNGCLRLPIPFVRAHLSEERRNIVLRSEEDGRAWHVTFIPDKQSYFSKGWRAFLRENHLKVGDCCALELFAPDELRATFFRASN